MLNLAGAESSESAAALPIGERDRRLWTLREAIFGKNVEALTQCPACGERMEFEFSVEDVRVGPADAQPRHDINVADWTIGFRLPVSVDLDAVAMCEPSRALDKLADRCILSVEKSGVEQPSSSLPDKVLDAVQEAMSQIDPQAEVTFQLTCAVCSHRWRSMFDIVQFLWSELAALSRRLVREVDVMARAYGWSESDILSLSPARRKIYLDLITS